MKPSGEATDIFELIGFLRETHQPGDLYRGQNRDYPAMIPSFYRNFAIDLSTNEPIVKIDSKRFDEVYANNDRVRLRYRMMDRLIKDFGLATGNILAQQYGLASETIDITEDIMVAAYFATRKYPEYSHISNPGHGVIYRFRQMDSDNLDKPFDRHVLNDHFEMGRNADGFFDFFVHQHEKHIVFERDKWWEFQKDANTSIVHTLRFITAHSDLRAALQKEIEMTMSEDTSYQGHYKLHFNWEKSRFYAQAGGLIRPRIYWEAEIPGIFQVGTDSYDVFLKRTANSPGPNIFLGGNSSKLPLIIPSAAIKKKIIGIENIRADPNCEAFLFNHSDKRITGFYRRELWPEPSEDALYAALWRLGVRFHLQHYIGDEMPSIDDAVRGLLDRGYYLLNERGSMSGRETDELLKAQLEDAQENISYGQPTALDFSYQATSLISTGNYSEAIQACIKGLRIDPKNSSLILGLAVSFEALGKHVWAQKSIDYTLLLAPNDLNALYLKSTNLVRNRNFAEAIDIIERAIELYDPNIGNGRVFYFGTTRYTGVDNRRYQ